MILVCNVNQAVRLIIVGHIFLFIATRQQPGNGQHRHQQVVKES